jgi:predicted Rossmann fold nucleotide-binding protein DprA/Smf involved in DNA uptake
MQEPGISSDTQAVLLLCGRFAPREAVEPLDVREYNRVVSLLQQRSERPAALIDMDPAEIDWASAGLDVARMAALLDRRMALGLAAERWTNGGLWVISQNDATYPERLRTHLGRSAPPLLWGVGEPGLASSGGVAIVGSRDVDEDGAQWCAEVAAECARQRLTVISGGARGVDQIAMRAALDAGGLVTAVLPEGLGKPSVASRYREAVVDNRLLLLSPFYPDAGFTVGSAMGRNKVLYGLAETAVVVRADARSGGTWAGAEEELKRETRIPLFVRTDPDAEGNRALVALGARDFPPAPWGDLRAALWGAPEATIVRDAEAKTVQRNLFDRQDN